MAELLKAKCKQGTLVITDTAIIVELSGFGQTFKSETLMRSAFVDLDAKKPALLATINLTFHGQGGKVIHADWIKPEDAKQVVALLTGRE